jgi:ribonuclease P protein component
MSQFSFSKHERLIKKKEIEALFASGKSFNLHPLRVLFNPNPEQSSTTHQLLFSVPSRNFKRAVDRNLIKRRLREAYRLNKSKLTSTVKLNVAYIYIAKEILPFKAIEAKLIESFNRLKG